MDHADIERLSQRHTAWRLLRAGNAPLVLSFLGRFFVEDNQGSTSATVLADALDDVLFALDQASPADPRYLKSAEDYLEDWSGPETGWLRRYYPVGSDEIHYDATPAFEKAYAWVTGLSVRSFVGTESRLNIAVDLLRQIVHGAETDPQARLSELHRRRDAIDREIADVEAGNLSRPQRHQSSATDTNNSTATARELLSDFREVEANFRAPGSRCPRADRGMGGQQRRSADRADRQPGRHQQLRIRVVAFQAFHDFLLSEASQDELADLLQRVQEIA